MSEIINNSYPDRIQDPEKAHAMALASIAIRDDAVRQRGYSARIEQESQSQQERIIEIANQKDAQADEIEMEAACIYDVREFFNAVQSSDLDHETSSVLAELREQILSEARDAHNQIDTQSGIGEHIELDAIGNLLKAGDRTVLITAMDIIENPKSEFFRRSYGGESNRQLAYRDLAIAAYQGGLIEEAEALTSLLKYESYKVPLLFAKAKVVVEAVPELVAEVGPKGVEDYKIRLKNVASGYISKGNLEPARLIVGTLSDKRKFALLAEMVEAGDESSIPAARETALSLRRELGAREIPDGYSAEEYRIRALFRLYEAGDEGALELAVSVAKSKENPWMRIKLLGWVGSEIGKRIRNS